MISDFSFSVSVLNSVEPVLLACKYKATVKTMNNQQMKIDTQKTISYLLFVAFGFVLVNT